MIEAVGWVAFFVFLHSKVCSILGHMGVLERSTSRASLWMHVAVLMNCMTDISTL
jgi:hypothetical protein